MIGEVVAGILSLAPRFSAPSRRASQLFPPSVAPLLGMIAQVGVILYMFLVGLELDTERAAGADPRDGRHFARGNRRSVPARRRLALWLYPCLSSSDVSFTAFTLFMGVSMSVTAFPVLARILSDRDLHRTRLGTQCSDLRRGRRRHRVVPAGLRRRRHSIRCRRAGLTALLAVVYIALMFVVARPLLGRVMLGQKSGTRPTRR